MEKEVYNALIVIFIHKVCVNRVGLWKRQAQVASYPQAHRSLDLLTNFQVGLAGVLGELSTRGLVKHYHLLL